jgi:hypothetical protein
LELEDGDEYKDHSIRNVPKLSLRYEVSKIVFVKATILRVMVTCNEQSRLIVH